MRTRDTRPFLALALAAALVLPACDLAAEPLRQADQVGVDPTGETVATEPPAPPPDPAPDQPGNDQEFVAPERIPPQQPQYTSPPPEEQSRPPRHSHKHRHHRSSD